MANNLSPALIAQLYAQESTDPFLILITLSHPDWDEPVRLVNNSVDIISRGNTYMAFPVDVVLPPDDGESLPEVTIEFDNVSLLLIGKFRTVTRDINADLDMILASLPDEVQMAISELTIESITYNLTRISARLVLDNFLNTEMTSEKYTPKNFPGIF